MMENIVEQSPKVEIELPSGKVVQAGHSLTPKTSKEEEPGTGLAV